MDGKGLKEIVGRIPDDAEVVKLCERYIAWRKRDGKVAAYSFYPERLDSMEVEDITEREKP